MKPGTPGFIGIKLKEAREARGISAVSLAELIGVSKQAVSQYENDKQSPRPEVLNEIASQLNLPISYFKFSQKLDIGTIFYRSMSAATKTARMRAERRYSWLRIIDSYIREFVQFPKLNFPKFDLPSDPKHISNEQIEEIAIETRRFWNIPDGEPIDNIVSLLEQNGSIIARDELEANTLDAFSDVFQSNLDSTFYMVLGLDKHIAVRSRFDAAHEYAHRVLHYNIDRSYLNRTMEYKLIEEQAHRFAGAFLLPANAFAVDFYSANLDALLSLKPKWLVSIAMMIKRSEDLKFISFEQARWLWISLSKRGWKIKEPLDDEIKIEQPSLLRKAFELVIDKGIQTRHDILFNIPLNSKDIEKLANLKAGYLNENEQKENAQIITLKPRTNISDISNNTTGDNHSKVLKFPQK
jgi:Zn-dependent peptidase ImmA (M78 family)